MSGYQIGHIVYFSFAFAPFLSISHFFLIFVYVWLWCVCVFYFSMFYFSWLFSEDTLIFWQMINGFFSMEITMPIGCVSIVEKQERKEKKRHNEWKKKTCNESEKIYKDSLLLSALILIKVNIIQNEEIENWLCKNVQLPFRITTISHLEHLNAKNYHHFYSIDILEFAI